MLLLSDVLAIFVYGIIAAMLGTILPEFSKRFQLSPKQNGNIAMAQAIGLMAGSFLAGPLMDVQGKKVGLLIGLGLIAIILFLLRGAGGYGSVAGLMFLLGLGGGAVVTGGFALAGDVRIGSLTSAGVFNIVNVFFGLGGLLTPLLAAKLFQNNSGRLLIFSGSLAVVGLIVCATTEMAPPSGKVSFQPSLVGDLLAQKALLLLALMLFLYVACEVGVWNWLVRHLIAQGVPEAKALSMLSLGFALGLLLGRLAASFVLTNVTPQHVLTGAAVLMAIFTFAMLQTGSAAAAQALVFLAGVSMAPVYPTTLAIVGGTFSAQAATATGIAATAGWFGLVCSSPLIGGIAGDDPKRLRRALLVLPAFSIVMVVVSLAL